MNTWFITGASRGFGARIAEKALAKGDAVIATARDPSTVTSRLSAHGNLLALQLDVDDPAQAMKFAVEALSESLRAEVLPLGIHVTAIEPGYFRTDILDASFLRFGQAVIEDYRPTAGLEKATAAPTLNAS